MGRKNFLKTDRIVFSKWNEDDLDLARLLWGNPEVTKYICATDRFSDYEEGVYRIRLSISGHHPDVL